MSTLYLCSCKVYNPNESHPIVKKFGRKVFQCEIWQESQEQAIAVAENIRQSEFPNCDYSGWSCEAQNGVTIEGNRVACQAIGQIYKVLPSGQVVRDDEKRE